MLEPAGHPDLAPEAVGAEGGAQVGVEQLEGDGSAGAVVGQEDGGHSAAAELALDGVAAGEGGLEQGAEVGLQGRLQSRREVNVAVIPSGARDLARKWLELGPARSLASLGMTCHQVSAR